MALDIENITRRILLVPVCLVGLIVVCVGSDASSTGDLCPVPTNINKNYDFNWSSKPQEWSNTTAKPAFLMLVLSWTPTYCDSLPQANRDKSFQCNNSHIFGLVVHGLWPQVSKAATVRHHPRNCRNEKMLNKTFVQQVFCTMPDEFLVQSQWEKHGTCYYSTATSFFTAIEKLYRSLNIPNIRAMTNLTAASIKHSFLTQNPSLLSSAIQVSMVSTKLKEVKICYDFNHKFIGCNS